MWVDAIVFEEDRIGAAARLTIAVGNTRKEVLF
jgi:hypothetical protein